MPEAMEPAPFGFLVSVRQFRVDDDLNLSPGDELTFDVVFEVEMSPIGQSRCVVYAGDRKCAEGELTFLSEE